MKRSTPCGALVGALLFLRAVADGPAGAVEKGTRLYALGHPHDLGLSIVEGTYNGHLEHMLYEKIHFTESLNQGMSGGPAITQDGRVVGVNVSTAGNQVSFLVPIERAGGLLAEVTQPDYVLPASLESQGDPGQGQRQ